MIEIAINEIAKYDMVQILQKAAEGEKVVLVHDNMQFDVIPNQNQINKDRQLAFDEFFAKMKGKLPKAYQFNREELYDRL